MHFPVIVVTETNDEDTIIDLLAPYDQNTGVEPYVDLRWPEVKKLLYANCENNSRWYVSLLLSALKKNDIEFLQELNRDLQFFEDINEQGDAMTSSNPRARWDFWGYGGRWTAILNGETCCRLKDFPRIRNEDPETVLQRKFPMIFGFWEKKQKAPASGSDAFLQHLKTRYAYALVTPSGEWIEPGRYAWWLGARAEEEEDVDWVEKFNPILDSYPQDHWVQLIDCHI